MSLKADLPRALVYAWLVLSAAAGAAMAAAWLIPADVLSELIPECPSRARGGQCPFCGMTTGFLLLARGELLRAREANPGAPLLFSLCGANFVAALSYVLMRLLRRRQPGEHTTCNSWL